jgi:spoIIIJ-associated protein
MVSTILTAQGFAGDVKMGSVTRQRMIIDIESTDDLGRIIGRDGSHLEALQTLVRAIIHRKFSDLPKIILDAGAYRRRRRGALKSKAKETGAKVLSTGKSIALEPMTSSERRMVHVLFEKDDKLQTLSKGNGRNRHIVIALRD